MDFTLIAEGGRWEGPTLSSVVIRPEQPSPSYHLDSDTVPESHPPRSILLIIIHPHHLRRQSGHDSIGRDLPRVRIGGRQGPQGQIEHPIV